MIEPTLPEKVRSLHRRLAAADIPHAFGGALCLGFYGEPRATKDIDVDVFIAPEQRQQVVAACQPLGLVLAERSNIERDGWETYLWDFTPIDVFYAYDGFHAAMQRDLRLQPWLGGMLPFLSPEHIVACKAIFDRPKDWPDIEQVLFAIDEFDAHECLRRVDHAVGDDDERATRLRSAIRELRGG